MEYNPILHNKNNHSRQILCTPLATGLIHVRFAQGNRTFRGNANRRNENHDRLVLQQAGGHSLEWLALTL